MSDRTDQQIHDLETPLIEWLNSHPAVRLAEREEVSAAAAHLSVTPIRVLDVVIGLERRGVLVDGRPVSKARLELAEHRAGLRNEVPRHLYHKCCPACVAGAEAERRGEPFDSVCLSCGDEFAEACPNSERDCGHHCNCSWVHDLCHWCSKEFGEAGD